GICSGEFERRCSAGERKTDYGGNHTASLPGQRGCRTDGGLSGADCSGDGGAGRAALHSRTSGARPCGALELQGGEMRVVPELGICSGEFERRCSAGERKTDYGGNHTASLPGQRGCRTDGGLSGADCSGDGGAGRAALHSRTSGARPCGALELQGGEMRVVL